MFASRIASTRLLNQNLYQMNLKSFSQIIVSATIGGTFALLGYQTITTNKQQRTIANKIIESSPKIQLSNSTSSSKMIVPSFEEAAEKTLNTVVHIKTISSQTNSNRIDPYQEFFFGIPRNQQEREVAGSGSGVIISNDGYIATNNHVINGAKEIEIILNDKRTYTANVVGTDPSTDLALLKIDANDLPAIYYGNSDQVNIGEWVLAVGNPFNLNSTVTAGIVSAKGRNINILKEDYAIESFIQTDAAVNPGNSGGALVNQNGQLIGINTAIASNTGSYTGYSFAVPVNMVKKIMGDLLKFGTVQRALLGVKIQDINQDLAQANDINDFKGVYVSDVLENGSADEADLQRGDIIKKVEETDISSTSELQEKIGQYHPGDKVTITYIRNGDINTAELILKNKKGTTESVQKDILFLGAKLDELSKNEAKKLGIVNGVKISKLEVGKFMREGIKQDFIITKINNQKVHSPQDVLKILKGKKGGFLIEGIYPNGTKGYYGLGM